MKRLILTACLMASATVVLADQYVNGYSRSDGTQVQGHYRSSPDNSYNNNWSVRGNTNPYTGEQGTRSPTYNDQTPYENSQRSGNSGYSQRYGSDDSDE